MWFVQEQLFFKNCRAGDLFLISAKKRICSTGGGTIDNTTTMAAHRVPRICFRPQQKGFKRTRLGDYVKTLLSLWPLQNLEGRLVANIEVGFLPEPPMPTHVFVYSRQVPGPSGMLRGQ